MPIIARYAFGKKTACHTHLSEETVANTLQVSHTFTCWLLCLGNMRPYIYASTLDSIYESKLVEALHRIVISFVSTIGYLTLLKKGII